jgi:hypothetical protein
MTQTYSNETINIELKMPDKWKHSYSEQFPVILIAPKELGYQANITFSVRDLKPPTQKHFEALIQSTREERMRDYTGFELVEELRWWHEGFPAYREIFHWNTEERNIAITQMFVLIMTGPDALFSIHCTALRELESSYLPMFQAIIESLEFYE